MKKVVRHIEYLLRGSEGCVVIPGVGAMLSRRESAHYDVSTGRFMPPGLSYSFNGGIKSSDGLLASSVARKLDIPFEQASRMVEDFAASVRKDLRNGQAVNIGRLGALTPGREGAVEFTPYESCAFSSPSDWLEPLTVRPLVVLPREVGEDVSDETAEIAQAVKHAWFRTAKRVGRFAAAVAVLVAVGFGVSFLLGRTAPDAQQATLGFDFSHNSLSERKAASSSIITRPGESTSPLVLVIRNHEDAVTVVDTTATVAAAEKAPEPQKAPLSMHEGIRAYVYVVASLATREDAERFVKHHTGELRILESEGGRYRVYAASGPNTAVVREKAQAAGLEALYPGSWVCRAK